MYVRWDKMFIFSTYQTCHPLTKLFCYFLYSCILEEEHLLCNINSYLDLLLSYCKHGKSTRRCSNMYMSVLKTLVKLPQHFQVLVLCDRKKHIPCIFTMYFYTPIWKIGISLIRAMYLGKFDFTCLVWPSGRNFFLTKMFSSKSFAHLGPVKTNIIALLLRMLLKPLQFIPWILIYIKACLREGTFWLGALILEMQSLVYFFFILDIRMCYVQCSIC